MSIPYLPSEDDSLDIHVEDLDSFELSDEQNMSNDYMSHGDAETKIFGSTDSSSNCEPDTTTSPPSKIKLPDPIRQPVDSECFCSHPKVAKFHRLVLVASLFARFNSV